MAVDVERVKEKLVFYKEKRAKNLICGSGCMYEMIYGLLVMKSTNNRITGKGGCVVIHSLHQKVAKSTCIFARSSDGLFSLRPCFNTQLNQTSIFVS